MQREMGDFDEDACSFVIRLWRESADYAQEATAWRGWIKHVQTGRRIFFQDRTEIIPFMDEFLTEASQQ